MESRNGATLGMTGSYNRNSSPQLSFIQSSIEIIKQGIDALDIKSDSNPLIISDFGSSHGSNSVYIIKQIIEYIRQTKTNEKTFLIIHNDLPTNNWMSLFDSLNEDKSYFGLSSGRSFYEQCLPSNSLTIAYSSSSIHWLSKKPCNILNHCVSLHSNDEEREQFRIQARLDYSLFLENRSRELVQGGIVILIIVCVNNQGQSLTDTLYNLLYKCAQLLPMNDNELFHYTIPTCVRSYEECIDQDMFNEFSFQLIKSHLSSVSFQVYERWINGNITLEQFAQIETGYMRSGTESILKQTLEMNEKRSKDDIQQLLDRFWDIYYQQVKLNPHEHNLSTYLTYLILKRL